jgi:hypothetical protein
MTSPTKIDRGWLPSDISPSDFSLELEQAQIAALMELGRNSEIQPPELPVGNLVAGSPVGALVDSIVSNLRPPAGPGCALVRGLDVSNMTEEEMTRIYWAVGCAMGTPVTQNRNGEYIGHVRLNPDGSKYRGYSSRRGGTYHCDYSPVAGLMCLQQGKSGGESTLASIPAIHNILVEEAPELLPLAYAPMPFGRLREQAESEPGYSVQQIFAADEGRFGGFYNRTLIDQSQEEGAPKLTAEQIALLDKIDEIAARPDVHLDFLLEPGEILFFNDFEVLHGRTTFEDFEDRTLWRHLLRLWLDVPTIAETTPAAVQYEYRYGMTGRRAA